MAYLVAFLFSSSFDHSTPDHRYLPCWLSGITLIVLLPPLTYGFVRLSSHIGTELCSSCFLYFKVSCQGQHYSGNPCSQPCLVLKLTPHKMSQQCDQYPTLCSSPDQMSDQLLYLCVQCVLRRCDKSRKVISAVSFTMFISHLDSHLHFSFSHLCHTLLYAFSSLTWVASLKQALTTDKRQQTTHLSRSRTMGQERMMSHMDQIFLVVISDARTLMKIGDGTKT